TNAVATSTNVTIRATYGGVTKSAVLLVRGPAQFSGRVLLESVVDSVQPITFTFRPTVGAAFQRTVTLAADGAFTIAGLPSTTYNVAVKGAKWLQKVVPLDLTGSDVSGVDISLLAGDVDDNNVVDVNDLGLLANAFNTVLGDPLWNAQADLNCD